MDRIPLVAVVGPTASGKTMLAVEIAKKYGGEVVSCDSMQIYRRMDIGTAKPTAAERQGIPHHMIDILEPGENYSVARYVEEAGRAVADIFARGRLPVLAGGTGLYYSSLVDNIDFSQENGNPALRESLRQEALRVGGPAMLERLRGFDPETAGKLHPNNLGRIVRAIEVYELTGVTMSRRQALSRSRPGRYRLCALGLAFSDRSLLYERIDRRVSEMFAAGLAGEVKRLLKEGVDPKSTCMQAIGYKEPARCLEAGLPAESAADEICLQTRHYAKRQLTWFRRDPRIRWIDVCACPEKENICQKAYEIIDKHCLL